MLAKLIGAACLQPLQAGECEKMHLVLLKRRCYDLVQEEILSSVDSGRRVSKR